MLSIKLLSNVEVFSLLFSFFGPPSHPSFLFTFQGLHCLLAFENDLLCVILWHMFSYLLHFLCRHTQSLSAPVCCGIVEPWTYRTVNLPCWAFHWWLSGFFAWRSVVWSSLAISQNGHLPHLWHFIILCCQLERNRLVGAYTEKNKVKAFKLDLLYIVCWGYNSRSFLSHPAITP